MLVRRICCFFAVCSLFLPVSAARAQTPDNSVWAGDARLQQTVSVDAEGVSVGELLARIRSVSGADISAARAIADEKVIVFGPARSVADLLTDIGLLLNGAWKAGQTARAADPPRYVLGYAPTARKRESDLRIKAARQRFRVLSNPTVYGATPEAPWRKIWADMATKPQNQAAFAVLRRLPNDQQLALMRGEPVFVSAQSLSQAEKETAALLAKQAAEMEAEMAADDRAHGFETVPPETPAPTSTAAGVWFQPSQDALKTMVSLRQGSLNQIFGAVANRDGFVLPAHGFPYASADVEREATALSTDTLAQAAQIKAYGWTARLRELARRSGRPVVADFYRTASIATLPNDGATPMNDAPLRPSKNAVAVMDAFCTDAGYLWWTGTNTNKTLFFRKRDWYEQNEYELPDRWYDDWTGRMARQNGIPNYGDIARLPATLTEAQIGGLLRGPQPTAPPKTDDEKRQALLYGWNKTSGKSVRNLLLILRAAPVQSKTRVPDLAVLAPKERNRAWITTARSTPAQKTAWATFARENPDLSTRGPEAESETFAVCFSRRAEWAMQKSAPPETFNLMLRYQIGNDTRLFGLSLSLPLRVPNDKRAQMRVSLMQAQTEPK